jgi:CRISPR-associated protein Csm4
MRVTAYDLNPRGPMHFGDRGVGVETATETYRADTLFSALCFAVLDLEGTARLEGMLAAFRSDNPPFLISSAFPRADIVRLVPRPRLGRPRPADGTATSSETTATDGRSRKILKKVRYVSWGVAGRAHRGENVTPTEGVADASVGAGGDPDAGYVAWVTPDEARHLQSAHGGALWQRRGPSLDRIEPWWVAGRKAQVPRVTVDRITGASTIFHAARVYFRPHAGLFVLVRWRDDAWRPLIDRAFRLLGDTGIGGERAIGHGQYDVAATTDLDLPTPDDANGFVTLAPYCPTAAEIGDNLAGGVLGPGAAWDLGTHGGWMGVPGVALRQSTITMMAEGSALRAHPLTLTDPVFGQLVDVTPDGYTAHRVYRYGYAFPWPATLPVDDEEEGRPA